MTIKLDKEELEILKSFEQGELVSARDAKESIQTARSAARSHFKKDARINIRISKFDLDKLKRISAMEGLPYQTMISSILHKFVS